MSYDLDFWKYKDNVYLDNQQVYEKCTNEEFVDGLEEIPIKDILDDIAHEFSEWERLNEKNFKGTTGSFEIMTTSQFIRIDCYGMDGETMNKFIDILYKYGCPLYDPQISTRFDGY